MPELTSLRTRSAELESVASTLQETSQALADSETQYRRLFEAAQDGILILDAGTGEITAVNPFLRNLLGYSEQEMLGKKLWEIGPFKDAKESKTAFHELQTREYVRDDDLPLETKDGRSIAVEFVSNVYMAGQTKVIQCNIRDLTERKRTSHALQTSELNYRALIESAADGIVVMNALGHIEDANAMGCRMLGYTREEVMALSIGDLVAPEEMARIAPALARVGAGGVMRDEWQARRKDGTRFAAEASAAMLPGGRVLGIVRDITERKEAEESRRLQSAALLAAADSIVITDRTGTIEWVNPAFTQVTGYTAQEAIGKHHRDLVRSGKQDGTFFKEFSETILAGRTWRGEIVNRRKDGTLYTECQVVTPVLDPSGAVTHFIAIQQDITEHLELEAQFRQAQKMESVGQLASGIAHDFNNLLTVINGMSELLLEQIGPEDPAHADVKEIQRAGERAAALTRQLLAFSRQQILEPRVMSVSTVVAGMENLLRRLIGEDIDLVVVPPAVLDHVRADPGQVEQVITNLVVNARDAMPRGGKLTIETESVTLGEASTYQYGETMPAGAYVRLAVGDSGVGMDESTRARIFEPFFTTKGPGKGTGLGLSTIFGIVRQSHGYVRVYSEVGHGTSFTIFLPQVTGAAGANVLAPAAMSSPCTETILVVEDSAALCTLATRFLEPSGYTVLTAATGEVALQLLADHRAPVDLLLTDVVMPGMGGRRLAERLVQTRPGMKVLYMSGYTSDTIVRHGVLEAEVPFLSKPFTAAALRRKVRDVLGLVETADGWMDVPH